ncbi:hypothetical protein [Demequina sp. SO4-18]|uniref:hypothetical protein n=1 Tax=Demequina sp. SO4-18 TaxID=3401026 RepID=UPI003B5C4585
MKLFATFVFGLAGVATLFYGAAEGSAAYIVLALILIGVASFITGFDDDKRNPNASETDISANTRSAARQPLSPSTSTSPADWLSHASTRHPDSHRNRDLAMRMTGLGGKTGMQAAQWLEAYGKDTTVPHFGVSPYWARTGPGGLPELTSMMGLRGDQERLEYIRQATAGDSSLELMCGDTSPEVRVAAILRSGPLTP